MTKLKFAVIGSPIEHSLSPVIHQLFSKQCGDDIDYAKINVQEDDCITALNDLLDSGYHGVNITSPLKVLASRWVDSLSLEATKTNAVNTILLSAEGKTVGYNTDGHGFCDDLALKKISLSDKNVCICGTGGAATSILAQLVKQNCSKIDIVSRDSSRAQVLRAQYPQDKTVNAFRYDELRPIYDLIINATSASVHGIQLPISDEIISASSICYDLAYSKQSNVFLDKAKALGVNKTMDGLGMLVCQASRAYEIWQQKRVDVLPVIRALESNSYF